MAEILKCRPLVADRASGSIMVTRQGISFWDGVDPTTGRVIDPRHDLLDHSIAGWVLAFPFGKGSAAAPLVLVELAGKGTGPTAIINIDTDPLLVAGPIIRKHFYGSAAPVVLLTEDAFDRLRTGDDAAVDGVSREITIYP